jgi:hypothetical protein
MARLQQRELENLAVDPLRAELANRQEIRRFVSRDFLDQWEQMPQFT